MTDQELLDAFALAAMQSLLTYHQLPLELKADPFHSHKLKNTATAAYVIAEAMMRERQRRKDEGL